MKVSSFFKPFSFIPAILMMYVIFSFSAQNGEASSSLSSKISHAIVRTADSILDKNLDEYQIDYYSGRIEFAVRKTAHISEYFLLAVSVAFPLYVYGMRGILLALLAGAFCVAFAGADEYHQSFISGRSPSLRDVGIDSIGVLFGLLLTWIFGWSRRRKTVSTIIEEKQSLHQNNRQQIPPQGSQPPFPYQNTAPMTGREMYDPEDLEDDDPADELDEDMPLSHLFRPRH